MTEVFKMAAASNRGDVVDGYGFERSANFDFKSHEDFMAEYLSVLARRAAKWEELLKKKPNLKKNPTVKRFSRKGIPNEHRPAIWMTMSGAAARMEANPHTYAKLLSNDLDPKVAESITLDLHRTFPDNIYFKDVDDPVSLRRKLEKVLTALAANNERIGYCQGMNFITALLLIVIKDDHQVFWLMDTLVNYILPDYYNKDMVSLRADAEVLGELIRMKSPDIHKRLAELGMVYSLISTKWFICLFADVMPTETVFRIWDALFFEGSKVLFRVAVTLFILNKKELMQCRNFSDVSDLMKNMVNSNSCLQCHKFIQQIFKVPGSFPSSQISKLRETCHARVLKDG